MLVMVLVVAMVGVE
uniref:Uncharacterized protein n=1 Tax=Rhizophora mucronata TaxID=61149 RepID=A0A2P2PHH0_RHIMU